MVEKKLDALYQSARETSERLKRRPPLHVAPLRRGISVSFEFFPPHSAKSLEGLWRSIERLASLRPKFVSVTYGAGGSTRDRTHDTVKRIIKETSMTPAAHLTCVGASRAEVDEVIEAYWEAGVRHIVALRGDPPAGVDMFEPHPHGYRNAADLVAGITARRDLEISVAAYPEVHPQASSAQADLDNLKRKIDAGAKRAITQFFFDIDTYLRFRDRVAAAGITVPLIPGILPVTNFAKVNEFAARCGATVPAWLASLFNGLDSAPDIRQLVSATVTAELCTRLADYGVSEFHFYTLNRPELTTAICHILGIRAQDSSSLEATAVNG